MGGSAKYRAAKKIRESSPYRMDYDENRKDKAMWTSDKQAIDGTLRESAGKWWNNLTQEEKRDTYDYTGQTYRSINKVLGGRQLLYGDVNKTIDQINNITSALEKSSLPEDMWLRRGVSDTHVGRLFGGSDLATIQDAINNEMIVKCNNFMSCSSSSEGGFRSQFELKIFAPKGTKGAYIEPISKLGRGSGIKWDGVSKQSSFGSEIEVLLQRGMMLKPVAVNPKGGINGSTQIVVEIVGQDIKPVRKQS